MTMPISSYLFERDWDIGISVSLVGPSLYLTVVIWFGNRSIQSFHENNTHIL